MLISQNTALCGCKNVLFIEGCETITSRVPSTNGIRLLMVPALKCIKCGAIFEPRWAMDARNEYDSAPKLIGRTLIIRREYLERLGVYPLANKLSGGGTKAIPMNVRCDAFEYL